jgi:hypothetical protein
MREEEQAVRAVRAGRPEDQAMVLMDVTTTGHKARAGNARTQDMCILRRMILLSCYNPRPYTQAKATLAGGKVGKGMFCVI